VFFLINNGGAVSNGGVQEAKASYFSLTKKKEGFAHFIK